MIACAGGPPRAPASTVNAAVDAGPSRATSAPLGKAIIAASAARHLTALKPVSVVDVDRAALVEHVRVHVTRTVPAVEIEREERFLHLLGALPRDEAYERSVYELLRGALSGMYEPHDASIYVVADLPRPIHDRTVLHEAVHALQDQHFDLERREAWRANASDAMLAQACLAEGDAAVAAEDTVPPDEASTYVARELMAPYVVGSAFVRSLVVHGGWADVDRAWGRPSLTTEQVLHPDKFWSSEPGLTVPTPSFASLGTVSEVWTDVRGELGLILVLASAVSAGCCRRGARLGRRCRRRRSDAHRRGPRVAHSL